MIERKIIIGLITSTEYLQQIQNIWNIQLIESRAAQRIAGWCIEYYQKFKHAPGKDIESIYFDKLKTDRIPKDEAEDIEQDILPGLSEEYEQEGANVDYLIKQTEKYFTERNLILFSDSIKNLAENGELLEAEKMASEFHPATKREETGLDLSDDIVLDRVEKAFNRTHDHLIHYPKQLGKLLNDQLIRGAFVAFMASEKRGKSYTLLDMAIRASRQKAKVAFFQAGDMTEDEQLRRICIYLKKKSDRKYYSGKMFEPIRDCVFNQMNSCDRDEREGFTGLFKRENEKDIRNTITIEKLKELYKTNKDHIPCYNCKSYGENRWGAVWLKEVDTGEPLTVEEAKEAVDKFFIRNKRTFKLSTHSNRTLTVKQIKSILDIYERQDNFVPDVIIIDYADLLVAEASREFRHQQNEIWMDLRGLSQSRKCLVITATQADAGSYTKDTLTLDNFSEDKRKYAHVTAMYGLNQDHKGREKDIGIIRVNEIVIREGDFSSKNQVYVLQNLRRGQPFLESFF